MKPNSPGLQLRWSKTLATGIAVVDEQHQRLIEIYNQATLAQQGATRDEAKALFDDLLNYTHYHFREEADLMREWPINPAHREMHLQAHESFITFLRKAQAIAKNHPADVLVDLQAFLAQWLLHHIAGVDARMGREIRALQAGAPVQALEPNTPGGSNQEQLVDVVSQLTDALGQRTFDLLDQRQKLLDLQDLYRALLRSGDALIQSRSEQEMLASLCAKLTQDTPFHTVWVGRPGASGVFEALALCGEGAQQVKDAPPRLTEDDAASVVVKAWNQQRLVVCNDTLADPTLQPWHGGFRKHQWLSILAVPLVRARQVWAVLAFAASRRAAFDERTVEVCTRITALTGFGLDELDLKSRIQTLQTQEARMARTDALTQLPNRFAFEECLPQAIARAHRRGLALAIGMLDLDDFKPVNDRFGHAVGDGLLQQVARSLRSQLRQTDFMARLGGDEFVILFEDLDPERLAPQLRSMLDRLHTAVETPFDLDEGRSAMVGMTMGLSLYPRDAQDPDSLLRLADSAMYAGKAHKTDRRCWWRIARSEPDEADGVSRETALDAFDSEASSLLGSIDSQALDAVAVAFVASFYEGLADDPEIAPLLRCLTPEELERLKRTQTAHLRFLLDPDTTHEALVKSANYFGKMHALVGVSNKQLVLGFSLYEDLLRSRMEAALLSARQRYRIIRVATARLRLDLQGQLQASEKIINFYSALLENPIKIDIRWIDALPSMLDALSELPGIAHAIVYRPDEGGVLQIAAGAGVGFAQRFDSVPLAWPLPVLNPNAATTRGPLSAAWFTRRVQVVDAYLLDPRLQPWHELARELGWRSAAAIPISSGNDTDSVLMLFGRYPHQFSSNWSRRWLDLLCGHMESLFAATARDHQALEQERIVFFRELLYGQGLRMWVQPIIDLQSGRLCKVEALARLHAPNGDVFMPGQFLRAFGAQELHTLFRQGLRQALRWVHDWREAGLDLNISVNLPPETLVQRDCVSWVEQELREAQVEPRHLALEILEDESVDPVRSDQAIHALHELGVRLALDDLGEGYSSLNRLASLPIDTIKIDQGLIRQLPRNPIKTIRLLATVVRIGREFAPRTVIEGLEDDGFIEVARLLGAQLGQGFGLARPMPADTFLAWSKERSITVPSASAELLTWPGALAYHWITMRDQTPPRHPGDLGACPLWRFLHARGIDDAAVLGWHRQTHQGACADDRQQASEHLLNWLSDTIKQAAAVKDGALQPAASSPPD